MNLIQVNRLDAQPAQRRVQRPGQMPRGQPGTVGRIIQREAALGSQHHRLSDRGRPAGQPAADDLLRPPAAVGIGRVDQRAARGNETIELRMRARLVSLHAEGHGPQAKGRHRAAATPQSAIFHGSTYASLDRGACPQQDRSTSSAPSSGPRQRGAAALPPPEMPPAPSAPGRLSAAEARSSRHDPRPAGTRTPLASRTAAGSISRSSRRWPPAPPCASRR